ncbi:hypothetical protein [Paludisphaera mucosa]|uniref:Uncharacterized protein n=1 Tax=Paludisphaera mucosa TaxID=3030827 RepID=A0ABT6FGY4_9BACT|nr:hypothetical protein [Paludisphaera mucosa]MDG3006658.1 hypothetical protein [Paludisphaera mucosa]
MESIGVVRGIVQSMPWFAWIALAAILSGSFTGIVKMILTHRERLAMIQAGIDPDAPHRKAVFDDVA